MKKDHIRYSIAEIFHEAWLSWSKDIAEKESLSKERLERWKKFWDTPWSKIPLKYRKPELELADKVIETVFTKMLESRDFRN